MVKWWHLALIRSYYLCLFVYSFLTILIHHNIRDPYNTYKAQSFEMPLANKGCNSSTDRIAYYNYVSFLQYKKMVFRTFLLNKNHTVSASFDIYYRILQHKEYTTPYQNLCATTYKVSQCKK